MNTDFSLQTVVTTENTSYVVFVPLTSEIAEEGIQAERQASLPNEEA
jgi:hypothetical protein